MQLFDNSGRRIPLRSLRNVNVADYECYVDQPMSWYLPLCWRRYRLIEAFSHSAARFSSADEFACRSKAIIKQIRQNRAVAAVLNGVYLPICLPQLKRAEDYGETLNDVFLPAVNRSFAREFHGRQIYENKLSQPLAKNLSVVPESRHQQLVEHMKQGSVVGIYFPTALQGFSVQAARKQMVDLPNNFLLSGGLDVATALAMYPDVLGRDNGRGHLRPDLILAGLSLRSDEKGCLSVKNWDGATLLENIIRTDDSFSQDSPGLLVLEEDY